MAVQGPQSLTDFSEPSKASTEDGRSSSVGSNIFDILVGLPIPWMIKIALNDASYQANLPCFCALLTVSLCVCLRGTPGDHQVALSGF